MGDCNGDHQVRLGEVVTAINIALGVLPLDDCEALDADGNGRAGIDEVVGAVGASLRPTLAANGTCLRPGLSSGGGRPDGLEPCAAGMLVTVSRCDDRSSCLSGAGGLTVLGFGRITQAGEFSLVIDMEEAIGAALVFEAEVEPATSTVYRTIAFGPIAQAGAGGGAQTVEGVLLSPVSEGATELLDENGLEQFDDEGVADVNGAVTAANADTDFSGQTAAMGIMTAVETARQDPVVQQTITTRLTPAPTATPTITPTATSTSTITPTPVGPPIVVVAKPVGADVRAPLSAGQIITGEQALQTFTLSFLSVPPGADLPVIVTSSDPSVADVVGTPLIPGDTTEVTLDIQTGTPGSAILRLRAGDTVRDLEIVVGEPAEVPAVTAPIVGVEAQ